MFELPPTSLDTHSNVQVIPFLLQVGIERVPKKKTHPSHRYIFGALGIELNGDLSLLCLLCWFSLRGFG